MAGEGTAAGGGCNRNKSSTGTGCQVGTRGTVGKFKAVGCLITFTSLSTNQHMHMQ